MTGAIPVYVYMLISVLVTLGFLGVACHKVVSELSVVDQVGLVSEKINRLQVGQESQRKVLEGVQARVFLVDENVERTRTELSKGLIDQGEGIKRSMKADHQNQHKTLDDVQRRVLLVDEGLKGIRKDLGDQAEAIESINANLTDRVDPQLADVKEALRQLELNDISALAAITKQADETAEIKLKLERLESVLIKPKRQTRKQKKEKVAGYIEILAKPK